MLLKNALLIDPFTASEKQVNILINKTGIIEKISSRAISTFQQEEIDLHGNIVCPGLLDMHCHLREPGFEYKEDIATGTAAAKAGGFTAVVCMANTKPCADTPEVIQDIVARAEHTGAILVYPIAAVTKGLAGRELTDFRALQRAGAIAFSDDGYPVENEELQKQAFLQAKALDSVVLCHSEKKTLSQNGVIQEGSIAEQLCVPGQPAQAEYEAIKTNLRLAEKTQARVHIQHVSCKESVELVRKAKQRGISVTAETCPHYFALTTEAVLEQGANAKMSPPLRGEEDRLAVIEGLRDQTIDAIATDHAPHAPEEKAQGVEKAPFGIIGFETCLGLVLTELVEKKHFTFFQVLRALTVAPRQILKLPLIGCTEGTQADLTIIDQHNEWVYTVEQSLSKSRNSPFDGWKFKGKALGIISGRSKICS